MCEHRLEGMTREKVMRTKKKDSKEPVILKFSLVYDDIESNIGVPYNITFGNIFEAYKRAVPVVVSSIATLSGEAIDYMVHLFQLHIIRARASMFPCPDIIS